MLAVIGKNEDGFIAKFERHLKHPVEKVWAMLSDNDKLAKWFSELRVEELREGGVIKFDFQDGTFEEFVILELKMHSVLEFTWGEDRVRFEMFPNSDGGCLLILTEKIREINNHTPKDLAGWHVCLDVVQALLDGRTIESREAEWEKWYPQYAQALERTLEQ